MNSSKFLITVFVYSIVFVFLFHPVNVRGMSSDAKNKTRLKVLEMFRHAYDAYMKNAFPADELMPLSCKGRYRGSEPSRGDVDDSLGNFTLSLIDSLDTLVVLGEIEEFEHAVKQVIENTKFDTDVIVSVFETNIRVVGGLLGGHVMAVYLRRKKLAMEWYKGELLNMAKDIGTRLLPAFNTTTGIPYPRINLKKGIDGFIQQNYKDTCTACAGTMVLEFAALSRFTGDPIFEEKAHKAMDFLWNQRHRSSDLVGTVINIHNGDWIRRDSGVGAGIDSYYEYVLKAYILLGDDSYLTRFNRHYEAVMKYVSQGPLFMDVHMHRPLTASKNFMDALLAFWPGLQVLKGDIPPAIEMHEMLYQVMQKHNFLPEAFTTDFHVHWGHHPLRPEFVESTYFLYRATGDPYYLEVGQKVVENLEKHARVKCGFAAIKDVTKGTQEDQMDSFVLAETFKYLYLLFADKSDLFFDMDDYIFTTEGHLLPLSLSRSNNSRTPAMRLSQEMYTHLRELEDASHIEDEYGDSLHNTCPNPKILYKQSVNYAQSLRTSLNISPNLNRLPQRLDKQCTPTSGGMRSNRLKASQFVAGNKEHVQQLRDMGIQLATMADGRIQLLHTASEAINPQMAEEGFIFMQEMIDLSKNQPTDTQNEPMVIQILSSPFESEVFRAGPAQFGYDLKTRPPVRGQLEIAKPFKACSPIQNLYHVKGKIAIIERGDCMFIDKARVLQKAGAVAGICIDHTEGSSVDSQPLFAMSGDGTNDVSIPLVFLFKKEGDKLLQFIDKDPSLTVRIAARIELVSPEVEPSGPGQYWEKQPEKSVVNQGSKNNKVFKSVIPLTSVSEEGKYEIDDTERKLGQIINFKKLEDGSQQMFFEFDKIAKYKSGSLPDMSSIYDSVVKILLEKTNFSKLDKQSEYLTAIAKLLESAHSGTNQADSSVQETIQEMVRELEVLTEEKLQEESLQEEVDNFEGTESLQTDGKTQVYNMEGVTITVKQSSSSSKRMSLSRNQADKVNDHKPYTDLSDTEVIQGPQDSEISDFSEEEISSESLYESVWSKTSDHFVDEHDLEQDADFRQLQAINSDLAQKLKNGIVEKRNKPIEQPQVTVKIVRKDISGNHVRKNIETIMVPEDDDEVHLREPDRSGSNYHTDEFRKSSKFSSQTSDGGDSETVTRTQKASVDSKGNDDNL